MNGSCLPVEGPAATPGGGNVQSAPFDSAALLAEADHRIANHLALLMGYVRLKAVDVDSQAQAPSRESVHVLLDAVGAQVAALARLHRVLISDSPPGPVDLGQHLHEVCAPFARGLCGSAAIIEDFAPGCVVRPEQVLPVSQITAEVLTNALKHACDGPGPGKILVGCHSDPGGAVRVDVIDSGCGLPVGFDPEADGGLGFRLVRGLGRKLGARIVFESRADGVRFRLTLPRQGPPLEVEAQDL